MIFLRSFNRRIFLFIKFHFSCTVSDIMCCLGLLGVILMIIENEIKFIKDAYDEEPAICCVLKIIITITTIVLVCLVFYYHRLDLRLYAVNNSLDHWRVGLTGRKIFLIFLEAFICAIHPIPQFFYNTQSSSSSISDSMLSSVISVDVVFGLPSKYPSYFSN